MARQKTADEWEIVDDLVHEMARMDWVRRRLLISRLVQLALAAQRGRMKQDPRKPRAQAEVVRFIIGNVLAAALARLGESEVICDDSAVVFSFSVDETHRKAAKAWFAEQVHSETVH